MAEASEKHWEFLNKLANDTGAIIIMPDYPLAPKHNYEDVFEMVVPLYQEIVKKIDVENLIMMGDSAGGGLSLALEEKIAEAIKNYFDITMVRCKTRKSRNRQISR